jgi:hypothetical protein
MMWPQEIWRFGDVESGDVEPGDLELEDLET